MRLWATGVNRSKLLKAGLIAGGVAALTAGERGHLLDPAPHGGERLMRQRRAARGVRTSTPVAMSAAIDPRRRLSEGALVQASVRARLLGIPLLRLDATDRAHAGRDHGAVLGSRRGKRPG